MKAVSIIILSLFISISGVGQTTNDSIKRIHTLIMGTWVDVDGPNHIMTISDDTVKEEGGFCWIYKIQVESARNNIKKRGQYWFAFSYHNCDEQFIQYSGGISVDDDYMRFYDGTADTSIVHSETFVFKRKR
jgi:hypothetical protein